MNLPKRIAFFSVGFIIGIILLFFFLSGKRASCAFFPTERVLKNIRKKQRVLSPQAMKILKENKIDTSFFSTLLVDGTVLFSESKIKQDSCNVYVIRGEALLESISEEKTLKVSIKNCTKTATIQHIEILSKHN